MLKSIVDAIKGKMQIKALPNETLINSRKLSPAKRKTIKNEATTPVTKGRKPKSKTKTK